MPPKQQPYVPGLTPRPDDLEVQYEQPVKESEASVVIQEFKSGRKNPTMCLHEYCAQKKIPLEYRQEAVQVRPGLANLGGFGFRAVVDGLAYPQGVASTKKDAKNEASKLAFRALIGLDAYEPKALEPELDDFRFLEVRNLSDFCEQYSLVYDKMMTKNNKDQHVCTVVVTGHEPFIEASFNRDEAVVRAHAAALFALSGSFPEDSVISAAVSQPVSEPRKESSNVGSRIPDPSMALLREEAAYAMLNTSLLSLPPEFTSYDHNIAAIFAVHKDWPGFEEAGKLVAFATGNSTIAVEALSKDGRCVIDSTCLVSARRAFRRYLAQEIIYCYAKAQPTIFEPSLQDPTRLRLKDGLTFHLYLSHPLDGDYKETLAMKPSFTTKELAEIDAGAHKPTFKDDMHGQLRCKNEQGMIELTSQTPAQTSLSAVKLANEMRVMSASDKLLRWNILGLQGTALTHITDPVYLSSVSLGYHSDRNHGHLCRAVCCRVYDDLERELPRPYIMNHPALSFVLKDTKRNCRSDLASSQDSINWNSHDKKIELTDGLTGRSHPLSPFQVSKHLVSRQCKAGQHFKWFKDICAQAEFYRLKIFAKKSPADVKAMAETYQQAKKKFLDHCEECDIGKWVHAPPELGMFTQ
ncbi:hypothetical protein BsWGS_21564 [Bradybaena similaris]